MHHKEFDKNSGNKQEILFGKCEKYIPKSNSILQPYSKPLLKPSSKASLQYSSKSSSQTSCTCERHAYRDCTLACNQITFDKDLSSSIKETTCNTIKCFKWEESEFNLVSECGCSL